MGGGVISYSSMVFAQTGATNKAIITMPERANGYLILDDVGNSTVEKWKITIQSISFDTIQQKFKFTKVDTLTLLGTYYTKIDEAYLDNATYFLSVSGYNRQNQPIVKEGPLALCNGCNSWWKACAKICNGKTYAYALDLWAHPNDGASQVQMNLYETTQDDPMDHLYQWMDQTEWQNLNANASGQLLSYYGIPYGVNGTNGYASFATYLGESTNNPSLGNRVVKFNNIDLSSGYYNSQGFGLSGTIYGVAKYYGPWENGGSLLHSNVLTGGSGNCTQNFNWFMGQLNANTAQFSANGLSPLTCQGTNAVVWPGSGTIAEDVDECLTSFSEAVLGEQSSTTIHNGFVEFWACLEDVALAIDAPYEWPQSLTAVTFKKKGIQNVEIIGSQLFDSSGAYIGQPIVLTPGFQSMSVQLGDYAYKTFYFELRDTIMSHLTQKDFFEAHAYPVPITGNTFSLEMETTANVKFSYELYDFQGNLIYSDDYQMGKGATTTEAITVGGGIPSGILINRFVFKDGSVYEFQSVK